MSDRIRSLINQIHLLTRRVSILERQIATEQRARRQRRPHSSPAATPPKKKPHAVERAEEHFGLVLKPSEWGEFLDDIQDQIRSGQSFIRYGRAHAEQHLVSIAGNPAVAVLDPDRNVIITVYPHNPPATEVRRVR